jgi:NAD(P)-dependent dehydrogenase (short-subunit alcohol dehydrogenase family)
VLVNVAGGSGPIGKTGWETSAEEFNEIVELNMTGCFNTMHAVLPAMIEAQRAARWSTWAAPSACAGAPGAWPTRPASGACAASPRALRWRPGPSTSTSTASRRAWWTGRAFARRCAPTWRAKLGITLEEAMTRHAADYALKRVSTDADVANACLFLASDVSRQITGVDLPVDGGWDGPCL